MRYRYEEVSETDFESLVTEICVYLLGQGVKSFSIGPDGGRDALFEGTAANYPNPEHPLSGTFVIQAKHTLKSNAKFSDGDFSGQNNSSVISKELAHIRELCESEKCDHYFLFSNRKLAGQADDKIRDYIKEQTGLQSLHLFGLETIERIIKSDPGIIDRAGLSELKAPLLVHPDDIAKIILALDKNKSAFSQAVEPNSLERESFEEKNNYNNVSKEFSSQIKKDYMRYFEQIREFLANPENEEIYKRYLDAVAEFGEQIVAHRKNDILLEDIFVRIHHLLYDRDGDLAKRKRLTKLVIYYMYWVCDIGGKPDEAEAN